MCAVGCGHDFVEALLGLRGDRQRLSIVKVVKLSSAVFVDDLPSIRISGVPLVDADDERAASVLNERAELDVMVTDASRGVDDENDDVGVFNRLQRLDDGEFFDRFCDLAALADTRSVDQRVFAIFISEIEINRIARGARLIERDYALFAEKRIY